MQKKINFLPIFVVFFSLCVLMLVLSLLNIVNRPVGLVELAGLSLLHKDSSVSQANLEPSVQHVANASLLKENEALREQFKTSTPRSTDLIPAYVVGTPTFIPNVTSITTLIIDKGAADGIKNDEIVVYKNNVVGKITKVTDHLSEVSIVTQSVITVPAQTLNGSLGVLKGSGSGQMLLANILPSDKISKGDILVTKGDLNIQGAGFPPNLVLGKIVAVYKQPSALFQTAEVQSLINFSSLSLVFVLVQ